jgi:outer membrane protein assembly factor BamB
LQARSGKKLWNTRLSSSIYSEPVVDGASVYIADRKGTLYSLSKVTGKIEWQVDTVAEISARPLVFGDTVYVTTVLKQLFAIDKLGRGKKWQTDKFGRLPRMAIKGSSSPVLYNGRIYVGYSDGTFVCYGTEDGRLIWAKQLSDKNSRFTDISATPLIVNNVIYISSADGRTFALEPNDGVTLWSTERGGPNDAAHEDGRLFVSGAGTVSALDPASGAVIWEQKLEEQVETSAPAVKDGVVVVVSTKDKIFALDAGTGEVRFKRYLGRGTFGRPVIAGKTLYIFTNSSHMHAFRGS